MKILVINCGSSSLKYSYFDTVQEVNNLEGMVERIGLANSRIVHSSKSIKLIKELGAVDHVQAFEAMLSLLTHRDDGVVEDLNELSYFQIAFLA